MVLHRPFEPTQVFGQCDSNTVGVLHLADLRYFERGEIKPSDSSLAGLGEWQQHVVRDQDVRDPRVVSLDDGLKGAAGLNAMSHGTIGGVDGEDDTVEHNGCENPSAVWRCRWVEDLSYTEIRKPRFNGEMGRFEL
jgi:hypothetical protein